MPDSELAAIGILFDTEAMGMYYSIDSWRLFRKVLDPGRLLGCTLYNGDLMVQSASKAEMWCIAVAGDPPSLAYVRQVFLNLNAKGLPDGQKRFIQGPSFQPERYLSLRGRVDARGIYVTARWNRGNHDECRETGWPYKPQQVSSDINEFLQKELEEMASPSWRSSSQNSGFSVACTCGESMRVEEHQSGKSIRCIICGFSTEISPDSMLQRREEDDMHTKTQDGRGGDSARKKWWQFWK